MNRTSAPAHIDRAPLDRRTLAVDSLVRMAGLAVVVLVALLAMPGPARAVGPTKVVTTLGLSVPASVDLGGHPTVTVRLTAGGSPVKGQLVSIHLGSTVTQQVTTGTDGRASAEIARDLSAGRYQVTATFAGVPAYESSSSPTVAFVVKPVELSIATVPAVPDISLVQVGGGKPVKTGPDGVARVTMTDVGRVDVKLALPPDDATERIRLVRWEDGTTDPVRSIRIPDTLSLSVGLELLHPVQFDFAAPDGHPVDAAEVTEVRVSDDTGSETSLTGPGPYWLAANAINRLPTGLSSTPLEYRVVEVPLGGQNVVNRGQQRFSADRPVTVPIELLVFELTVQGRDALLKTPTGSAAVITGASGDHQAIDLDPGAAGTIRLPRGEYRIALDGGLGIALSTPVILSRDQQADVLLISLLDVLLVVGAALLFVFGLIFLGRPWLFRRRRGGPPDDPDGPGGGTGPNAAEPEPPALEWPDPATTEVPRPRS